MSEQNKTLVPKSRFPEFQDDWAAKKLGELGTLSGGGTPDKSVTEYWQGDIPWVSSSDIYEDDIYTLTVTRFINEKSISESATKIVPKGSVLFVSRVGTGKLAVNDRDVCTSQDFMNFKPKKVFSYFLGYFFIANKSALVSLGQGTSIKGFSKGDLEKLKVSFPSVLEQQKIADCLSSIDELITAQTKKIATLKDHKKGLMQQLYPLEGETVPKLRFAEFQDAGEWEEKALDACLDYLQPTPYLVSDTNYSDAFKTPVLTAGKTFILGYTNEQNGIFNDNLPVIIFDDFTTATQFVDFPFKAKSSAMKILLAKPRASIKFMYELMQMIAYEVGTHERHWISKFAPMLVLIPSPDEQKKIADCLSSIDALITSQTKKLQAFKTHKKGLMQQLFPDQSEAC